MANVVTQYCEQAVGVPYVFATPRPITTAKAESYDCSGLAACAWLCAGIKITPYTVTMYAQVSKRPAVSAQPGDLIFYQDGAGYIYHVAICIGNGQLIEAPEPGENVHIRSYSPTDSDLMPLVGALPVSAAGNAAAGSQPASAATIASVSSIAGITGTDTPGLSKVLTNAGTVSFWERVGLGALGVLILAAAVLLVFKNTKAGASAASHVKKLGEVAALA